MKNEESAFPQIQWERMPTSEITYYTESGMSLRDWFAGQALSGVLNTSEADVEGVACVAYEIADAILKERERREDERVAALTAAGRRRGSEN